MGIKFFFLSMQGREPPPIHVAHTGRYAKFWLEPVSVADARGFRGHETAEIRYIAMENASLFLEKWHEYFGGKG